ncbi:YbhN family protein [Pseudonocardia aurantiaca]|uniref:YbhN family protein n=1 Tax=Pseudonocardia aurantiaca TaxID=75290 RepID=A0ABW4FGS0_9PSEU
MSRTRRGRHRRVGVVAMVVVVLGVELVVGAPALGSALHHLRAPVWSWIGLAVLAEAASMGVFARMQRRLLAAAGTWVPLHRAVALAYASHSLSVTLPGGPVFSTAFNLAQMRRFGASPAAAAWTVALSGTLSSAALVLVGALGEVIGQRHHGLSAVAIDIVVACAVAVVVRALVRHPNLLAGAVTRALRVVNSMLRRPVDRGRVQVVAIVEQLCTVRLPGRDLLMVAGFAVGNWLLDAACFGLSALAVGADIRSLATVLIAYTAGMAAASIPLVPGGLGVVDAALVLGLIACGTPADAAIATTIVYRLISFGLVISTGWVSWLLITRTHRDPEALTSTTTRGGPSGSASTPTPSNTAPLPPTPGKSCSPRP